MAETTQEYFRLSEIALKLGCQKQTLSRAVLCGSMPPADLTVNRMRLWHRDTIAEWLKSSRPTKPRSHSHAG